MNRFTALWPGLAKTTGLVCQGRSGRPRQQCGHTAVLQDLYRPFLRRAGRKRRPDSELLSFMGFHFDLCIFRCRQLPGMVCEVLEEGSWRGAPGCRTSARPRARCRGRQCRGLWCRGRRCTTTRRLRRSLGGGGEFGRLGGAAVSLRDPGLGPGQGRREGLGGGHQARGREGGGARRGRGGGGRQARREGGRRRQGGGGGSSRLLPRPHLRLMTLRLLELS